MPLLYAHIDCYVQTRKERINQILYVTHYSRLTSIERSDCIRDMDYFHTTSFYELDVYWIVLIALGVFMCMASIVTIIVLCVLWRRYQTSAQVNSTNIQIPVQFDHQSPLPNYETQVCWRKRFDYLGEKMIYIENGNLRST